MSAAIKDPALPFHDPAITPLAKAVAEGDIARIRALAPSTNLSAHGDDNVTLLEWAIWNQKPASLSALLEAGADPAMLGMDNETVAHMAAMVNDPKYLQVLITHKAPVDLVGDRGSRTPIFRTVESRRDAQFDLLVDAGADIRRTDSMGNSLLHVAAQVNDADRVLQLLQLGVDPGVTNEPRRYVPGRAVLRFRRAPQCRGPAVAAAGARLAGAPRDRHALAVVGAGTRDVGRCRERRPPGPAHARNRA